MADRVSKALKRRARNKAKEKEAPAKKAATSKKAILAKGSVRKIESDDYLTDALRGRPSTNNFRPGRNAHVSDLLYECNRKIALSRILDVPIIGEPIFDNQGLTFAQGNAIQAFVMDRLKVNAANTLYGRWTCLCRNSPRKFVGVYSDAAKKAPCKKCGHRLTNYSELSFVNKKYRIVGNVDLLFLRNRHFYVGEIKSMQRPDWEVLSAPIPDHVLQVVMYWYIMRHNKVNLFDKASIVYATKAMVRGTPYKEFVIEPARLVGRLNEMLTEARELKNAESIKSLPPRRKCASPDASPAKKCQFCSICFSVP